MGLHTKTRKEIAVAAIIRMQADDVLELKKPHPCGNHAFKVLRLGSEVRIKCLSCGRDMVLDRIKLEKAVKRVIPSQNADD